MPARKRKNRRVAGFEAWQPFLYFGHDMLRSLEDAGIENPSREQARQAWARYAPACRREWKSRPGVAWAETEFGGSHANP